MGERSNRTYRGQEPTEAYVGDPFSGAPAERSLVESVAEEYGIESDILARSLGEAERSSDLLTPDSLFSGFDPLPVGVDGEGHLYLVADVESYWDVVGERLGLTPVGQEAFAAVHDRLVKENSQSVCEPGDGLAVTCPGFPSDAIEGIHRVVNKTSLSARRATIWMLEQKALESHAIADILGLPVPLIESELVAIDREAERVNEAARILDLPNDSLTRLEPDPNSERWMGLHWSAWFDLQERRSLLKQLPRDPGLYRVRHTELDGLLYVGETGAENGLRDRVGHGLAVGLGDASRPQTGNHDATAPLWDITSGFEGCLEVSVATPPVAADKRHRLGIESSLVAAHRRETGRTPPVMLNRNPLTDQSSVSGIEEVRETIASRDESYMVPSWKSWRSVTSSEWLGFDWTAPRPLSERAEVERSGPCVFRIWQSQSGSDPWCRTLVAIGTTESLRSRLFTLENQYSGETTFSVARLLDLSQVDTHRSRELEEVRYDLVGSHYLATGVPPRDQF